MGFIDEEITLIREAVGSVPYIEKILRCGSKQRSEITSQLSYLLKFNALLSTYIDSLTKDKAPGCFSSSPVVLK